MAQGHLVTPGTRDSDMMFLETLMMNMREVPSCYGSHANNTTKVLRSGSIIFVKNSTCQPTIDLLRFIVMQIPCRSGLYLKHEPNVKTLLLDIKMMVFPVRLTVLFAVSKQLSLSANPDQLRTGRLESNLLLSGEHWQINSKFSSLTEMTRCTFIVPALDTRSPVLSIKD